MSPDFSVKMEVSLSPDFALQLEAAVSGLKCKEAAVSPDASL